MERTDPRERYDDLVASAERHEVGPDEFDELREAEVFDSGWGVAGVVFDDTQRDSVTRTSSVDEGAHVLAIRNEAYETEWTLPGGAVEPGEALGDAVVREVREETGVEVEPVRPLGVDESVVVCGDRRVEMRFVHFLCRAVDPAVSEGGDLGDPDEEILEARWLDSLPDDVFNPEHTRDVYEFALELFVE
ncbi:MAG: NUDIX hydrolase [Halosimplex sp.]